MSRWRRGDFPCCAVRGPIVVQVLTSFSASSGNDQELLSCWLHFPSRRSRKTPLANNYNIGQSEFSLNLKAEGLVPVSAFHLGTLFLRKQCSHGPLGRAYGSELGLEGKAFGMPGDWRGTAEPRKLRQFPQAGPQVQVQGTVPTGRGRPIQLSLNCQVGA